MGPSGSRGRGGRRLWVVAALATILLVLIGPAMAAAGVGRAEPRQAPGAAQPESAPASGVSVEIDLSSVRSDVGTELVVDVVVPGCPGVEPEVSVTGANQAELDRGDDGRWRYAGANAGIDTITATVVTPSGVRRTAAKEHIWTPTLDFEPEAQTGIVDEEAALSLTVQGVPISAVDVQVTDGPNRGTHPSVAPGAGPDHEVTYTGGPYSGTDTVTALVTGWPEVADSVNVTWDPLPELSLELSTTPSAGVLVGDPVTVTASVEPTGGIVTFTVPGREPERVSSAPYEVKASFNKADKYVISAVYELSGRSKPARTSLEVQPRPKPELVPPDSGWRWQVNNVPTADEVWLVVDRVRVDMTVDDGEWSVVHDPDGFLFATAYAKYGTRTFPSNTLGPPVREAAGAAPIFPVAFVPAEPQQPVVSSTGICNLVLEMGPDGASSVVGQPFASTVRVTEAGVPLVGSAVTFGVDAVTGDAGPEPVAPQDTDGNGEAALTYTREAPGVDGVTAEVTVGGQVLSQSIAHTWLAGDPEDPEDPEQQGLQVVLGPVDVSTLVGSPFTTTAVVNEDDGTPVKGAQVSFEAVMPDHPRRRGAATTNADGAASFTYEREVEGTEQIIATATLEGREVLAAISHTWVDIPGLTFTVSPTGKSSEINSLFTATAQLRRDKRPVAGARITFATQMPRARDKRGVARTRADGTAKYGWRRLVPGVDQLTATYTAQDGTQVDAALMHVWRSAPPPAGGAGLILRDHSVPPGADVPASGFGCTEVRRVLLTLEGKPLTTATANAAGEYATTVSVPEDTPLDDHTVTAACGGVAQDELLNVSQPGGETATPMAAVVTSSAVLTFFLLLGGQILRFTGMASPSSPS